MDPLLCDLDLPDGATFYPAGFPLRLATNSAHVVAAAAESWEPFQREFDTAPLDFRVIVLPGGEAAAAPVYRKQNQLLSFVSDAQNFAIGDCLTLCASFHLAEATAADHAVLRWFFLEAMAYMLLTQRYVVSLHTACVARGDTGILLCGKSGAGKSTLSFACARDGFTYVADDCTWLLVDAPDLIAIGKPHQVRFRHDVARHFPELEGYLARTRPSGKVSIEVPTNLFPTIHTANRCELRRLVFLDREGPGPPCLHGLPASQALEFLVADLPSYGPEVNAAHDRTVERLAGLPAFQLRYDTLEEGIALLRELP